MCVSTVSVRRDDWKEGQPKQVRTRTEVGRPDWDSAEVPDEITPQQLAELRAKYPPATDDEEGELDLSALSPEALEAGQAVADEILTGLNGVEATALDSAFANASPNVQAHFANILMSGRTGEELVGFADALEEVMDDATRREAHTFLRNLTDAQAQAIKRALGI